MWTIALLTAALAHSPHDAASTLSIGQSGSLLTNDSDLIAASTDRGQTFRYVWWPDRVPICLMDLGDEVWIVGGEQDGAWRTEDGGLSFALTNGPPGATACAATTSAWWMAGEGGVWRTTNGQRWEHIGGTVAWTPVTLQATDDGIVSAVDEHGDGWMLHNATWSQISGTGPLLGLWILDDAGEGLVAGQVDDWLSVSDDGGETWTPLSDGPMGARVFASDGDLWLAATAEEAVWVSEDAGATWRFEHDGLDSLAEGHGGPSDGIHYDRLDIDPDDGRWTLASFEGLFWRTTDDDWWQQGELDVLPRTRSVAWIEDDQGEGDLLVGSYGGGVARGEAGGTDWREVSAGIGWSWPRQALPADSAGDSLMVVTGSVLALSHDAGETWAAATVGMGEAGDHVTVSPDWSVDGRAVVGGRTTDDLGAAAWTNDSGATWTTLALGDGCTSKPRAVHWPDGDQVWLACGTSGRLYRSDDGGQSWSLALTLGQEIHVLIGEDPVLMGSDDGVWRLVIDDADVAHAARFALDGEAVFSLAMDPSGDAWAGVGGRGMARLSPTGAVGWIGWPDGDLVQDIAVHSDGRLAVANRTGAWLSEDGGESWARAMPYDRIDDALQHWRYDGFETVAEDAATGLRMHAGNAGATAWLSAEGVQIRLRGGGQGATQFSVAVDGAAPTTHSVDGFSDAPIWAADVNAGRHNIEIEVLEGRLLLDGAERWIDQAPPLPEIDEPWDTGDAAVGSPPAGRCGCKGNRAGWLLIPLGLLLPLRRRHADDATTPR